MKVSLRKIKLSDAGHLLKLSQGDEMAKWSSIKQPKDISESKEIVCNLLDKQSNGKGYYFMILADGLPVGRVGIFDIDQKNKIAEIGIWVGQDFWGRGIATLAIKEIVEYGCYKLNLLKIKAEVAQDNIGSRRALEKNGFSLISQPNSSKEGVDLVYEIELA
jgi:ribosomal-protein-alanine N-acetyltransferase